MGADIRETPPQPVEIPADLQRHGLLGRFPALTEDSYHGWLVTQIVPLARILTWVSMTIWIAIPPVFELLPNAASPTSLWMIGIANTLICAAALVLLAKAPRWVLDGAMLAIVAIGLDLMYLQATVYDETGPGTVIVAAVFNTLLTPLLRLPVRSTVLTTVGLIGPAVGWLLHEVAGPEVTIRTALPYFTFAVTAVPVVIGCALVGEALLRAKYVDEQVIERQQALLVESRRLIRRYAPASVADLIEHGEGISVDLPQRRRVTVLFSDVVGFTDLADRLDPEALTQVVNEYLAALAEIIERHRGTLNEFAGDGVMAIFGAPTELDPEDQVRAAVAAAREIQSALPELNQAWMKLGVDHELQTRIGINTGVLSVGSFGSEGRATYTGIGLQTNITARIQSQCEPGGILLSHTSWQLVKETVPCESRGEVTVKGVHFPIAVFAPLA